MLIQHEYITIKFEQLDSKENHINGYLIWEASICCFITSTVLGNQTY